VVLKAFAQSWESTTLLSESERRGEGSKYRVLATRTRCCRITCLGLRTKQKDLHTN
jgi:hypothetical protein